jgi:putative membrane protein
MGPLNGPLWNWVFLVVMVGVLIGYFKLVTGSYYEKHSKGEKASFRQRLFFVLGIGIGILSLLVPMEVFGDNFVFTVHMIQHLLFSLVVPPLLILGTPSWLFKQIFTHHYVERIVTCLTIPFVASLIFNGNLWLWHAPPLFQAMMANDLLHVFVNVLYIVTGLLFWWPLLNPLLDEGHTLSLGGKLAYLFFSDMPMMLLGAGMIFSRPLYSMTMIMTYPTGSSIMQMPIVGSDQQLGGLLMWIVGSIYFIVLASIFFLRWMLRQEAKERAQELYDSPEEEEYNASDINVLVPGSSMQE